MSTWDIARAKRELGHRLTEGEEDHAVWCDAAEVWLTCTASDLARLGRALEHDPEHVALSLWLSGLDEIGPV